MTEDEIKRRLAEKGLGGDANERADPEFFLSHTARTCGVGPWYWAQSGGVIHYAAIPKEWRHWKNVYLWHPAVVWDRAALEDGWAIASWPCQQQDWSPPADDTWADYVGLYFRRPARKWLELAERIGLYGELCNTEEVAEYLEENIGAIMETARRDDAE